ncbi:hypothetical protein [Polaromonas sp. UBA4122]|uniref:hypothetical protein n=1 Tax=Polaromonas sp. UBA4122 TaxID=1947074 RepID=UPI0025F3059A|nr:hypothetical protein [Polaromonas sp. UBA4122]
MPRFNVSPPDGDSRKALEQRAREAAMHAIPQKKGRWPFPVADTLAVAADHEADPSAPPDQPGQWRGS